MERDFETVMIEQCAPVLAGLKPAGLFRYETRDRADLARRVAGWNAQLNPKGLQVRVLRGCIATRQYLVYVYRAAKLQTVLADAAVRGFLAREGYRLPEDAADCNALLDQLSLRLCCAAEAADFPHEIGVFLGYPLEDVIGFCRHKGEGCKLCGYWKVYGDVESARKSFALFDRCRELLFSHLLSGAPLQELVGEQPLAA